MNHSPVIPKELPINEVLGDLIETLKHSDTLVLEAPPGAGKTTCVPLEILNADWYQQGKILMLEPRRLAAKAAAERMAGLLGEKVGQTVGYRVRLDSKISPVTKIEVVTEGILGRMLQSDPSLEAYSVVIFDEFHERSLDADLGLALTLEGRTLFRDEEPLRIVVMSATLDGEKIASQLDNAPIISSRGKQFPVSCSYHPVNSDRDLLQQLTKLTLKALDKESGSLLVFLPGQGEIRKVEQQLQDALDTLPKNNVLICPLYGDLNLQQQRQAIEPSPSGQRKIVLATRIAETSLTIDGISAVIDSGLSREARFDPNTAISRLVTRKVTQAEATQRAGRAGRLAPGNCYRLWSESQQQQLAQFAPAEITQADLSSLLLQLLCWGIDQPEQLCWLDQPPAGALAQAKSLLQQLGAVTDVGHLTPHGELMAELPTHPRIAHMLIRATELGLEKTACQIAALLTERDPLSREGSDLEKRLNWLTTRPAKGRGVWQRIRKQTETYLALCSEKNISKTPVANPELDKWHGLLIAFAYPDRVAEKRKGALPTYRLSNGRAVTLHETDPLQKEKLLAVAISSGSAHFKQDRVQLASPISFPIIREYMADQLHHSELINWNPQEQRLIAEQQLRLDQLIIERKELSTPSEETVVSALCHMIQKQGLQLLPWNDALQQWRDRVMFLHKQFQNQADNPWPDLSEQYLLANLPEWLGPYLGKVRQLSDLKKLALSDILLAQLPWPLPQQLEQLAPERFRVPSGSRIRIDYSESPPVLAVKLQEMFGSVETPRIANGVALKLHLLSPAQRPLQVTQDLTSFWENGYKDVQKDMKGRYPKHPWPDDPLTAVATAYTKGKKKRD